MPGGKLLIEFEKVSKSFMLSQGELPVLEDLSFQALEGEFITIVGPSGCGKSTLLKLVNGLISPTSGKVNFCGQPLEGINLSTAMVFQDFALLPWLTVYQNVELGLEVRMKDKEQRKQRVEFYVDKVGLGGYEEAYPRELSGGMKQRVGLARALAVEPEVLLMDEPFSSVDVLTGINLRDELIDIWCDPDIPVNTIMMVTHIIEEAVELADRIMVLSASTGNIAGDLPVALPRPRERKSPAFSECVDKVFSLLV